MPIKVKPIKPGKMNTKVFRKSIRANFQKQAPKIVRDFSKTTRTWSGVKPKFPYRTKQNPAVKLTVFVGGDEKGVNKWFWNNDGTKPHVIKPVNGTRLFFQSNFRAKTQPRVIGSRSGGSSGPVVAAKSVNHPGTEPREWTIVIAEKWEPILQKTSQIALEAAADKSGQGI